MSTHEARTQWIRASCCYGMPDKPAKRPAEAGHDRLAGYAKVVRGYIAGIGRLKSSGPRRGYFPWSSAVGNLNTSAHGPLFLSVFRYVYAAGLEIVVPKYLDSRNALYSPSARSIPNS